MENWSHFLILGAPLVVIGLLFGKRLQLLQRSREVKVIAQGEQVTRLLTSLSADFRLSHRELVEAWLWGAVLALLSSFLISRLVVMAVTGNVVAGLAAIWASAPAVGAGALVCAGVVLWTHYSTETVYVIRGGYVEQRSRYIASSWRLPAEEIESIGVQVLRLPLQQVRLLVLNTRSGATRRLALTTALSEALSDSGSWG